MIGWVVAAVAAAVVGSGGPPVVHPAQPDTDVTLFLIGDAGVPHPGFEPVLAALTREASAPSRAERVIVFLGDNIYPQGMPAADDPMRKESERRIDAQMAVAKSGARTIFIPGNHDWDAERDGGWDAIRRQGEYIERASRGAVRLLPSGGCPGPAVVDVGARVRLVLLDTQWWLQHGPRPDSPGSGCATYTAQGVTDSLHAALVGATAAGRLAFVLTHHPLESGGQHSGRKFVVGWAQRLIRSDQDIFGPRNRAMRDSIERAFTPDAPLVYASGHDHALQVIGDGTRHLLVSGAGAYDHLDPVHAIDSTHFDEKASGYMRLDVMTSGQVRMAVHLIDQAGGEHVAYSEIWR
jgi:hypothetical protein